MSFVSHPLRSLTVCVCLRALVACGAGSSTETTIIGGGASGDAGASVVALDLPSGPNTTEIDVDSGPASAFSLGAANIPYVTVTVCTPGSATQCISIDHVLLDTGSVGLRIFKSAVSTLMLPPVALPPAVTAGPSAGTAVECYPFVLGALWGALAVADVRIASEMASGLPIQLIDDAMPPSNVLPSDCIAASNGSPLNSVSTLQANGVLGVGMIAFDCGIICIQGNYTGGYTLYYACPAGTASACVSTAIPVELQVQNPVAHFASDNNGTVIAMPSLPDLGAGVAKGRLVFGIGTQTNNQIPSTAQILLVDPNPASPTYLYLSTTWGTTNYVDSYIDSGSNALFFDDATIAHGCQSSSGSGGGWFCPSSIVRRTATLTDSVGSSTTAAYAVANADALFSTSSLAFSNLAGSVSQGGNTFVWGMPFFYGRTVFTSIWGQALSPNGPWNAF